MKNTPTTPVDTGKEDSDEEQQNLPPLVDKAFRDALLYSDKIAQSLKDNIDALATDFNSAQQNVGSLLSRLTTLEYQAAETEVDLHNTRSGLRNITGGRGMAVSQGLDGISISYDRSIKWEFTISGDTSMNIGVGSVIRNDTPVTSAATDLTGFSTEGTYYILATLSRAAGTAYNPRLIPDTVTVTKSTVNTWPSVDTAGTLIYVLGEVVVNSSSVISDFTQYISDDIHDWQDVPDGQRHVSTNPSTRTLNRNPTDNVHKLELEMYGAEVATLKGAQTWVSKHGLPMLLKDAALTGDLEWYGLDSEHAALSIGLTAASLLELYTFASAGSTEITGTSSRASRDMVIRDRSAAPVKVIYGNLETFQAYRADLADGLTDYSVITHAHENHTFNTDDHDQDGTDRYIINNGTAGRNNMSGVIGSYDTRKSVDPFNRILYDNQGTGSPTFDQIASVNWVSRLLVDKLGATVLKWDLTTDNWLLKFNATNQWDKTTFLVDVTGAIAFLADTTLNMNIGADSTWTIKGLNINCSNAAIDITNAGYDINLSTDQNINLIPTSDDTGVLNLGTAAATWAYAYIYGTSTEIHGDAAVNLISPSIRYNSKIGLSFRSEKVRIPTESGGYVEAYITNGGITVD